MTEVPTASYVALRELAAHVFHMALYPQRPITGPHPACPGDHDGTGCSIADAVLSVAVPDLMTAGG